MRSSVYLGIIVGFIGMMLSFPILADAMAAESRGGDQRASSEWEMAKEAVRNGDTELLEATIDSRKGIVNKVDGYFTLLGLAASKGDFEIVKMLVEEGADPDIANGSALYEAMPGTLKPHSKAEVEKRMTITLYLIRQGASLNHEVSGSIDGASLAEVYIMGLCDKDNNPEYSTEFLRDREFEYPVLPVFRSNYVHIAPLAKEEFGQYGMDRECVDFMFRATGSKGVAPYDKPILIYKTSGLEERLVP